MDDDKNVVGVQLKNGTCVDADMVIFGQGIDPAS